MLPVSDPTVILAVLAAAVLAAEASREAASEEAAAAHGKNPDRFA